MKVLIADNDLFFRSLLSHYLGNIFNLRACGEASDGHEALHVASSIRPELVIINPLISSVSGIEVKGRIAKEAPSTRFIALYEAHEPFFIHQLQNAGFHACISRRSTAPDALKDAIKAVMRGDSYYCDFTNEVRERLSNDARSFVRLLSAREQQILSMIGGGMGNSQIGSELGLSPATVQTHRRNLFKKLGFHDTPSLMRYAIEQGFWSPDYNRLGLSASNLMA